MIRFSANKGFTLVELSIVLVIIGLLVGAFFVAGDLLRVSSLRSQISQFEKYNAAVNTFQFKYKSNIPGDVKPSDAVLFGFTPRVGTFGRGDGNGLVQMELWALMDGYWLCGEQFMFWSDLSRAQLVDGNFLGHDGSWPTNDCQTVQIPREEVSSYLPLSRISGGMIVAASDGGVNHWYLVRIFLALATGGYPGDPTAALLSPLDTYAMDVKMDDGLALYGKYKATVASGSWPLPYIATPAPAAPGVCVVTGGNYNLDINNGASVAACIPRIDF